jgi:hypothetical protein
MKASGANQIANAGMQNVMGGLQGMNQYAMADQMYGETGDPTTRKRSSVIVHPTING